MNMKFEQREKKQPVLEYRRVALAASELRLAPPTTEGETRYVVEGYAVKWNEINSHGERFLKGCFTQSVNAFNTGTPVHMYYNHGHANPWEKITHRVGKWLELLEDDIGLYVRGELTPRLSSTNDISAMIDHQTLDGISICFYPLTPDQYEYDQSSLVIKDVKLYEISIVDEPSARQARITGAEVQRMIGALQNEQDAVSVLSAIGLADDDAAQFIEQLRLINNKPNDRIDVDQTVLAGFMSAVSA